MIAQAAVPAHAPLIASQPRRPVFVLVQTAPCFAVLATADDFAPLDAARQAILDAPWDQERDGERALSIHPATAFGRTKTYIGASTRNRDPFQRRNRFR